MVLAGAMSRIAARRWNQLRPPIRDPETVPARARRLCSFERSESPVSLTGQVRWFAALVRSGRGHPRPSFKQRLVQRPAHGVLEALSRRKIEHACGGGLDSVRSRRGVRREERQDQEKEETQPRDTTGKRLLLVA
jgi:hypothetical protein